MLDEGLLLVDHVAGDHSIKLAFLLAIPHGAGGAFLGTHAVALSVDVDHAGIAVVDLIVHIKAVGGDAAAVVVDDFVHVVKDTANRLRQQEAGAVGRAGCAGDHILKARHLQQVLVVGIAAGGQHHGGSAELQVARFHAHALVAFHQKLGHLGVVHDLGLAVGNGLLKTLVEGIEVGVGRAHRIGAQRTGYAQGLHGSVRAAHQRAVAEIHAQVLIQPVDGRAGFLGVTLGQRFVELTLAAESLDVGIEGLGGVLNAVFLLDFEARTAHGAARIVDAAARAHALLKHQHIQAQLHATGCGHQTGHAGAYHDHIRFDRQLGTRLLGGAVQGVVHGFNNAVRGQRCAGNGVHVGVSSCHNSRRNLLKGRIRNAGGFVLAVHRDGSDCTVLHRNGDGDVGVHALAGSGIGAVGQRGFSHSRDQSDQQGQHKQQAQEYLGCPHGESSLLKYKFAANIYRRRHFRHIYFSLFALSLSTAFDNF